MVITALGWMATAVFVASYFCPRPALLRAVQMSGAALWVLYGALIGAAPVVVANLLVLAAAAWTARRSAGPRSDAISGPAQAPAHPRAPVSDRDWVADRRQ